MRDIYDLVPRFDTAKSYYGKAQVELITDGAILYSYGTIVAKFQHGLVSVEVDKLTQTTLRHVKEFLKQNGYVAETKKQIIANYGGILR